MSADWVTQVMEAEKCFRRACSQIMLLNRVLEDMQTRYDSASKHQMRAFRYSLRIRISVMEGVRNMYYQYATIKADLICRLRHMIQIEHGQMHETELNSDHYVEIDTDDEYDFSDSEFDYSDYDEDEYCDFDGENYVVVKDTTLDGSMDNEGAERALLADSEDSIRDTNNGGDKLLESLNDKDDKKR